MISVESKDSAAVLQCVGDAVKSTIGWGKRRKEKGERIKVKAKGLRPGA